MYLPKDPHMQNFRSIGPLGAELQTPPIDRTSEKPDFAVPLSHFCKFNIRTSQTRKQSGKFRSIENAHFHNMSLVNPFETQLCGGPWWKVMLKEDNIRVFTGP